MHFKDSRFSPCFSKSSFRRLLHFFVSSFLRFFVSSSLRLFDSSSLRFFASSFPHWTPIFLLILLIFFLILLIFFLILLIFFLIPIPRRMSNIQVSIKNNLLANLLLKNCQVGGKVDYSMCQSFTSRSPVCFRSSQLPPFLASDRMVLQTWN